MSRLPTMNTVEARRSINFRRRWLGPIASSSETTGEKIARLAATVILSPSSTTGGARLRVRMVKCVDEANVINPFHRSLKRKCLRSHKLPFFFGN